MLKLTNFCKRSSFLSKSLNYSKKYTYPLFQMKNHDINLNNTLKNKLLIRSFAKISKKDKEKAEFNKRKQEAELPQEIDLSNLQSSLEEIKSSFSESINKLKIGRIIPELFDEIEVSAYGDSILINQIAQILPRDGSSLIIKVYDPSIQNEVLQSLNSNNELDYDFELEDMAIVARSVSKNTKESRKALANQGKGILEKNKIAIRKLRNVEMDRIKKMKEFISKDVSISMEKEIGALVDKYNNELANLFKKKEAEILRG
jgi:ribosome recycling factor